MHQRTEVEIMKNWKGDINTPLVSVCTITYNHEEFITETLDSFLMQETNFPFEIVIDEDCSPDNTANIIREYKEKYPNIIDANLREKNVGMSINGIANLQRAKGKYIALCEGDDYWTDPLKLQKQVDFLEKHEDYSACAHNSKVILHNQFVRKFWKSMSYTLELEDVLHHRKFHTASLLFRTNIVKDNPLPDNILSGDRAIYILLASFGSIKYFGDTMCVYRKHDGGVSSWVTADILEKDLNIIPWIKNINSNFPIKEFKAYVHETILLYPSTMDLKIFIRHYILFVFYSFSFFPNNLRLVYTTTRTLFLKSLRQDKR